MIPRVSYLKVKSSEISNHFLYINEFLVRKVMSKNVHSHFSVSIVNRIGKGRKNVPMDNSCANSSNHFRYSYYTQFN